MGNLYCCEELIYVWEQLSVTETSGSSLLSSSRKTGESLIVHSGGGTAQGYFHRSLLPFQMYISQDKKCTKFHSNTARPHSLSRKRYSQANIQNIFFIFFCFHRHYQVLRTDFISALINEYMSGMHNKEFVPFLDYKKACHVTWQITEATM